MKSKESKFKGPAFAQATARQALALGCPQPPSSRQGVTMACQGGGFRSLSFARESAGVMEPAIFARILRRTLPRTITISNLGQFLTPD